MVIGALAGVVATGPMTVVMILLHRRLPRHERYPLPPREITMKLARKAGVAGELTQETRSAATLLAHFGYGAVCGAIYATGADRVPVGAGAKGPLFGLLVWATSYLGLLPGAGILSPATKHPARRNALMIIAHLVWGAVLAVVTEVFLEETKSTAAAPLAGSILPHRDVNRPS